MFARNKSGWVMAAGLVMAGAVHAGTTAPVGNGSDYPAYAPSNSTLTRAEVQAQVVQAQRDGTMAMKGDRINTYNGARQTSTVTRAEVRQQARDAMRAGRLPQGESFGE